MRYRNKLTGIEMEFSVPIAGENWEPVEVPDLSAAPEKTEKTEKAVKNGGKRKKQLRDSE